MTSTVSPTPRFFYGWVILASCFLITMVASGTMMAFGVFITPLANDMGWSRSALSFTYALSSIVSGVGVLAIGSLMHSFSVRRLLLYGALIHGFGMYMTSTVTSIEGFYFWYGFLAALGRSAFFISTTKATAKWRNLLRNPGCSGIIDNPNGKYIYVTGTVELSTEEQPLPIAREIIHKYKTDEEFGPYMEGVYERGNRGIIRLKPERIVTRLLD